jgi:hypothetical protein
MLLTVLRRFRTHEHFFVYQILQVCAHLCGKSLVESKNAWESTAPGEWMPRGPCSMHVLQLLSRILKLVLDIAYL